MIPSKAWLKLSRRGWRFPPDALPARLFAPLLLLPVFPFVLEDLAAAFF
jgi:hypothetical protein